MKKTNFELVANVKKFATQGSKGGSIILTLELAHTDENCMLSAGQNLDCAVFIKFDTDSIQKLQGQPELDFDADPQAILIKGRIDKDVNYRYIDNFTGEVVNAHLPLAADVEDDVPTVDEVFNEEATEGFEDDSLDSTENFETENDEGSEEPDETENVETEDFETEGTEIKDSETEKED